MEKIDREITPEPLPDDVGFELSLRPRVLNEYIGQNKVKENLRVFIEAAKGRKVALDHTLFYGPPGLGKTTLAYIIANELGVSTKATSGPVIERAGDLAAMLTNLSPGDVFFIDEIHRLNSVVEEILYPAMEDFKLDVIIGEGPSARSIKIELPQFTLIGATTRAGLLTSPLRDRFGIVARLDFYDFDELTTIVMRSSKILGIKTDFEGAKEIAKRARGTPRVANRLLRRVRDFADVEGQGIVDLKITKLALERLEVDEKGLDAMDRKIILTIIDKFDGGPVGVDTLSSAINEEADTIEEVYEPYLIQQGYINRTPRGRLATRNAYEHFGKKRSGSLF